MALSSIFTNVEIKGKQNTENFINSFETAEKNLVRKKCKVSK